MLCAGSVGRKITCGSKAVMDNSGLEFAIRSQNEIPVYVSLSSDGSIAAIGFPYVYKCH